MQEGNYQERRAIHRVTKVEHTQLFPAAANLGAASDMFVTAHIGRSRTSPPRAFLTKLLVTFLLSAISPSHESFY